MVWSIRDVRSTWTIVERSGTFWVGVQGEKKRKKRNKVRYTPDGGHDTDPSKSKPNGHWFPAQSSWQISCLDRCHDSDVGTDYFSFCYFLPLFPFRRLPCFTFWTILCLFIHIDSQCTIVTHPRTPILGPEGCTMTHGLIP